MHRLKRRFEIAATVLFLSALVVGTGQALAGLCTAGPGATAAPAQNGTSSPTAPAEAEQTAPAETRELTPEPTELVDKHLFYDVPMSEELQGYLYEACEETGVPFEFALALIANESDFRPEVISATDDYGLMQINACNHKWLEDELGVEDFLDPEDNISAGLYILSGYFEKYEDPHMVLMTYNMGEYGAQQQWAKGVYQSKYSRRVLSQLDELQRKAGIYE